MGISSPSGGKRGPGGKPYLGTLWETDRVGMLLSRDRRPSRIFTRFLTAARRAIDARQRYGNERDVFPPTHRDSEPGLALAGTGMSRSPGCLCVV